MRIRKNGGRQDGRSGMGGRSNGLETHGGGWGQVGRAAKRNEPPTACRGEGARARRRYDGQGCRRRACEVSLLERADVEPRRRAADSDEVAQYPVDLEGIGDDGEDPHGVEAVRADERILAPHL